MNNTLKSILIEIGIIAIILLIGKLLITAITYVKSIPTKSEVTKMIEENNYNLLKASEFENSKGSCKFIGDNTRICFANTPI